MQLSSPILLLCSAIGKKLAEAHQRSSKKQEAYEVVIINYDTLTQDAEDYLDWLQTTATQLRTESPLGVSVQQVEETLQQHNVS